MKLRHTGIVMLISDDLIFWVRIQCAARLLVDDAQREIADEIRRLLDDLH
ncbi:hypothetical protein AWB68_06575 [Caballeronia choica]|jgi:hypothetical protein|uniref:Uncharacterized protein n=1 Tax=Caballeronia choica TaxID=326476 RepID=A0A158KNC9_9BURK|nr:hypothetical protein AWB68_06575 [Caballeronia choica]